MSYPTQSEPSKVESMLVIQKGPSNMLPSKTSASGKLEATDEGVRMIAILASDERIESLSVDWEGPEIDLVLTMQQPVRHEGPRFVKDEWSGSTKWIPLSCMNRHPPI